MSGTKETTAPTATGIAVLNQTHFGSTAPISSVSMVAPTTAEVITNRSMAIARDRLTKPAQAKPASGFGSGAAPGRAVRPAKVEPRVDSALEAVICLLTVCADLLDRVSRDSGTLCLHQCRHLGTAGDLFDGDLGNFGHRAGRGVSDQVLDHPAAEPHLHASALGQPPHRPAYQWQVRPAPAASGRNNRGADQLGTFDGQTCRQVAHNQGNPPSL